MVGRPLIVSPWGTCLRLDAYPSSLDALQSLLAAQHGRLAKANIRWITNGRVLDSRLYEILKTQETRDDCVLRAELAGGLLGGKGGFGANLKSSGRGAARGSTNFNLCRDLQGRRLGSVNNEERLRIWLSEDETARRKKLGETYEEPRGESGFSGWYLGVPSWSEGGKEKAPRVDPILSRKKTDVCRHWLEAREGRTRT
jgi:hypothetical protein